MRIITFFTFFFVFQGFLTAQKYIKVSNLNAERDKDNINITYQITGSKTNESFHIKISASTDGRSQTPLISVSGDVGTNVSGGKERYTIVWDVLRDLDQLGSAEFFITAEKVSDASTKKASSISLQQPRPPNNSTKKPHTKRLLLMADVMYDVTKSAWDPGIRIGYYKNVGAYVSVSERRIIGGFAGSTNPRASTEVSAFIGIGRLAYNKQYYDNVSMENRFEDQVSYIVTGEGGVVVCIKFFTVAIGASIFDRTSPYFILATGFRF